MLFFWLAVWAVFRHSTKWHVLQLYCRKGNKKLKTDNISRILQLTVKQTRWIKCYRILILYFSSELFHNIYLESMQLCIILQLCFFSFTHKFLQHYARNPAGFGTAVSCDFPQVGGWQWEGGSIDHRCCLQDQEWRTALNPKDGGSGG